MTAISLSDIYARVHKGLRKALFDLAYAAGRTDYTSDSELASLGAQAAETACFLQRHGYVEDTFQLPVLESRAPGSTLHYHEEHHRIESEIARLVNLLQQITSLDAAERMSAGESWYLQLNRFISDYLAHMDQEETTTAPLFMEHCSADDFRQIFAAIMANSAPEDSLLMLKYTIPSIDPYERANFLGTIRKSAPPAAFETVMQLTRSLLKDEEWSRLEQALG